MIKRITYILFLLFIPALLFSQQKAKIQISKNKQVKPENRELIIQKKNGFILKESIIDFNLIEENTKEGQYNQIVTEGMNKTYDAGKPDLPVFNRLIEIPFNSKAQVKIVSYDEEIINLTAKGLTNLIIPAQPSYAKSINPEEEPFIKDKKIYNRDKFFKKEIIKFEDKGYLRNKHLGYIEISPFAYNPVTNILKVITNIEIDVTFIPEKTERVAKASGSPYFNVINYNTINAVNTTDESKSLISGPVKYVIVSDPMFEETLQPFIEWKTMKGFKVVEAYTDNIGTSETEIKNYLQDLYENPNDGISPTFVLLVGDVDQIPTFSGTAGGHKTDLYYCEYTGDNLPEVFYGRFSAESIAELQAQIDKTLEVEKFQMPDPSYLENVVLVAGVDGSFASKWGNGAINYANSYYTNTDNGVTSYYYLYNDDSGVMASNNSGASASIRSYISSGVSFANYTAHCGISGWSDPSFNVTNVDELTNEHMYPLIIGNCCESNTFNSNDCFGEKLLITPNKGAVGYIGGSNLTYWDEDYYWGIGVTSSITVDPTYENSGLGAYDRFFHLNGETKEDWYVTQGQVLVAGNLAVESSTSGRKTYYWEIYHLMGDPSLTPYVSVPANLVASYNSEITVGHSSFHVVAEEDAYVALSRDGVLLDAQLVGATGDVNLTFDAIAEIGTIDIVITKQNRIPIIDEITIIPSTTPYVVLDKYLIDDNSGNNNTEIDFGETINLDVQLKNLAQDYDAYNLVATLNSADTNIIITDNTESFGTILKDDSLLIQSSYTISFKNKFTDQQNVSFNIIVEGEDSESNSYTWNSTFVLTVNSAELELGDLIIDDSAGNNNGILDPGETGILGLVVQNVGEADIVNLNGSVSILGDGVNHLSFSNTESGYFSLEANKLDTILFNATVDALTPEGTYIYLSFIVDDIYDQFYSKSINKELSVGNIPEVLISHEDTITINNVKFYDSGGKDANYSNDENYTITFKPEDSNKFLAINFDSFIIESESNCDYDKFSIYNGMSVQDELIGSYCGTNSPGYIVANNTDGALTFVFTSDYSETRTGWEAEIRSYMGYNLQLNVADSEGNIENAVVQFVGRQDTTDVDGNVTFGKLPDGIDYPLIVNAEGYEPYEMNINLYKDTSINIILDYSKFDIRFTLTDEEGVIDGDVTFDGKTLTTTDGEITFNNVIYSNSKEFQIQSFGHKDSIATIEVKENKTESIELISRRYNAQFVISDGVDPIENATVEFGTEDATTTIDGIANFNQIKMDSSITYIVRKSGYENLENKMDLSKDTTVNLTLTSGVALFKVTFLVNADSKSIYNAEVVLGNDTLYTNAEGMAVFDNITESYNIPYKISKTHFVDITGNVDITGENVVVDKSLTYTTYQIIFSINDGSDPIENAIVGFDGKSGNTDANGECSFEITYALNKNYSITKEGYSTGVGMINVDEDKTINVSLNLITYNVLFNVIDASSHVMENVLVEFNTESKYTNGEGVAEFTGVIPGNNLDFILSKEGYWNYDSTLNVVDDHVTFYAQMSEVSGVETVISENDIKIYPNPSNGLFSLEVSNLKNTSFKIKIFDVIGSVQYLKEIEFSDYIKEEINLSDKPKGIYFLSIESDDGSLVCKRIIIK